MTLPPARLTYAAAGVNYEQCDEAKVRAQAAALTTANNLLRLGFAVIIEPKGLRFEGDSLAIR